MLIMATELVRTALWNFVLMVFTDKSCNNVALSGNGKEKNIFCRAGVEILFKVQSRCRQKFMDQFDA